MRAKLIILLLVGSHFMHAQPSQLAVYKNLLQQMRERLTDGVSAIRGDTLKGVPLELELQKARPSLSIDFPEIAYTRLGKLYVRRQVLIHYSLNDSTSSRGFSVQFVDTLALDTLRKIRKDAPPGMRGGAVTSGGKLLRAVGLVGSGIGLVLLLFRLRS